MADHENNEVRAKSLRVEAGTYAETNTPSTDETSGKTKNDIVSDHLARLARMQMQPGLIDFKGKSLAVFRSIQQPADASMRIVERDGKFFIVLNDEEWHVQMHPDSTDETSKDRFNLSKRLSLSREENGIFYHAYIRRDDFFIKTSTHRQLEAPQLNTVNITHATEEAKTNAEKATSNKEKLQSFDIPKDRPIGYVAMIQEVPDTTLDAGNPREYATVIPSILAQRGYDIRFPDGSRSYIETGDAEKDLKANLEKLYDSGIRVFYVDLIAHGHKDAGMSFIGKNPPSAPSDPALQAKLQQLETEEKDLTQRLSKEESSNPDRSIMLQRQFAVMKEKQKILGNSTILDADETIKIIDSFLDRDPSCKFILTSLACYGGGFMSKFQAHAETNKPFKNNVALFLEAKGYQPGIPATYLDPIDNKVKDYPSYYRAALARALQKTKTFGQAVAIADEETGRIAEADPESLVEGVFIP